MKKPSLSALITAKLASLRAADHRSRERIRRELRALQIASQIKRQLRKERSAA